MASEETGQAGDDWQVVFSGNGANGCADRALVLMSLDIPHFVQHDAGTSVLLVPASVAERAKYELWQYERENRAPPPPPRVQPVYQDGLPGVLVYVAVLLLVAWFAATGAFGFDWLGAGRVDGTLIRQGEWWRSLTALTLHSGMRHLLGNLGFGMLFGLFAGRLVGSGVAWFSILTASGLANLLNTVLLESAHRSIGASTAVFAALGLLAGYVWRARLMAQDRWPYRLGPVVGGIALLAYTGTGDANTDVGAHLAGFLCGFGAGVVLTMASGRLRHRRLQLAAGSAALLSLLVAWLAALQN
ncbi:MAG: rhomboid family intramembrane serine protease [Gammaproteobacteria bacterium]|nr:MAG: rhomboid family intramembrane serine protease [Gammaproteobacteria bacterium]